MRGTGQLPATQPDLPLRRELCPQKYVSAPAPAAYSLFGNGVSADVQVVRVVLECRGLGPSERGGHGALDQAV